MTQVIQTSEQQFYLAKLLGYSYDIVYKPRAQNKVADALSRVHDPTPQLMAITVPHCELLMKLQIDFEGDVELQDLISKVQ